MEHVAIMRKSWGLTQKILAGEKKIESRWYKNKYAPWDMIKSGETLYFKDSGEKVSIKTEVDKVIQFSNLDKKKIWEIIEEYGESDGIANNDKKIFFNRFKNKKYCILIFLKNPQKIKSFAINKEGFGMMSAWLCVKNIDNIKY